MKASISMDTSDDVTASEPIAAHCQEVIQSSATLYVKEVEKKEENT